MIYLSDDYLYKYIDTLGYIFSRSIFERYSLEHIEYVISHSRMVDELENSNVTTIAFSSAKLIYFELFPLHENGGYQNNPYDEYGWISFAYIHLFLKYQITFEMLFTIIPIKDCLSLYKIYHEMDITHLYKAFEKRVKYSYLDNLIKKRKMSSKELSYKSGLSYATIRALRYSRRDINKIELNNALKLSNALNIKLTSLLTSLSLKFHD